MLWRHGESSIDDPGVQYLGSLYAAVSPDGAEHWPLVWEKSQEMLATGPTLTAAGVARIAAPTLVLVGDDDVIRHDHTVASFESEAPDQDFRASASTVVHIWYTASRTLTGSQGQPRSSLK